MKLQLLLFLFWASANLTFAQKKNLELHDFLIDMRSVDYNRTAMHEKPLISEHENNNAHYFITGRFESIDLQDDTISDIEISNVSLIFRLLMNKCRIKHLNIDGVSLKQVSYLADEDSQNSLRIDHSSIGHLSVDQYRTNFKKYQDKFHPKIYAFESDTLKHLFIGFGGEQSRNNTTYDFSECIIDTCHFGNMSKAALEFNGGIIKYLDFHDCVVDTCISFLKWDFNLLTESKPILNFSEFAPESISKILFDYQFFDLSFQLDTTYSTNDYAFILTVFDEIIATQGKNNFTEGKIKAIIEKRNFILSQHFNFREYLSKLWWNYSYNKELAVKWTLLLFILFSSINFFFGKFLIEDVYQIPSLQAYFSHSSGFSFWGYRVAGTLLYSAFIFFGLKLDTDKFTMIKKWQSVIGTFYLLLFYLTGIFCLAFIGKYLLDL